MEVHSREMQVTSVTAINPDKVRVTLGDIQANPGGGPGAGMAGPAMGGGFSYDVPKEEAPAVWDILTVTVNSQ